MKLAVVLVLLVVGTVAFHFLSPWWFTPIASNWSSIDFTVDVTFWVTGIVFILVNCFLAYVVYRFRYSPNRRAHYEPENRKLELGLTIVTTIGVVSMLAPGLFVWAKFIEVPKEAKELEVVAQQWHWGFRFPGEDGMLGRTHVRFFDQNNPFGIDPNDEAGQDDIVVDDKTVHLPINQPVKVLIRSKDVLHNFAVPQFRVKMDAVPGLVSYLWFTPERLGTFDILCMELCGVAHFAMRGNIKIEKHDDFQQWLSAQPTFAQTQSVSLGNLAMGEGLYAVCAGCHGASAEGMLAMNAPALNGQSKKYLIRQLQYYKNGVRGANAKDTFGQQMAAMSGTLADDDAVYSVAAYIASLNTSSNSGTIDGNSSKGRKLYESCSKCHGKQGEGNIALNAPRLADVQDWYLKRQLINFQQGIRGAHSEDTYGPQMILMAKMISDEQAINDLVSFIATLKPKTKS